MRRLSERARLEGMLALRKALDGVRRGQSAALAAGDGIVRASFIDRRDTDFPDRYDRAQAAHDSGDEVDLVAAHADSARQDRDAEFLKGLERIADSIERVATQLDSYHQERAEHLDAIEFLLREMVISTVPSPASRPAVLGGVVESEKREISLVVDEAALAVDAAVEVRSRFHDRWIGGFTIAEAVNTPGRRRYRLTRRSDGIPLPILFEACDVRAAEDAFSRQHAPS
jgi:hypothetical protein